MNSDILKHKLFYGFCFILLFFAGDAYSSEIDLKKTLYQLETSSSIPHIYYKVQVGSFGKMVRQIGFITEKVNDLYCLTHGNYQNFQEAAKAKDSLIYEGFKDAWVAFYLYGERTDILKLANHLNSSQVPEEVIMARPDHKAILEYLDGDSPNYLQDLLFFEGSKVFYSYILYAIILFLGTTLSLILTLIFRRNSAKIAKAKKKLVQQKINGFLSDLILEDDLTDELLNQKLLAFRSKIPYRKDWCKELLIKNIVDLKRNFKGELSSMFITIYLKLDLLAYSEDLIKNQIWYQKTKGIFHFEELGYSEGLPLITPYILNKNKVLKSVALIAYISLKEKDPLNIFNNYSGHIDEVDELKILDTIKKRRLKIPANINEWLHSENTSLVLLTIKMIAYYNHLDSGQALLDLLDNKNEAIRKAIIIACGQLYLIQAELLLIAIFEKESLDNQVEIIKTLAAIGSSASCEFLSNLLESTINRELKIESMRALKELNSELYHSTFNHNLDLQLVKLHVEDPYLS